MIKCTKDNVTLDGPGDQILTELVIVLVSVYESMKDIAGEEFASALINGAYTFAMKEIDKEKDM